MLVHERGSIRDNALVQRAPAACNRDAFVENFLDTKRFDQFCRIRQIPFTNEFFKEEMILAKSVHKSVI